MEPEGRALNDNELAYQRGYSDGRRDTLETLLDDNLQVSGEIERFKKKPEEGHHCPRCGYGIPIPPFALEEYKPFAKYPKHCDECGQALDWSDYESN